MTKICRVHGDVGSKVTGWTANGPRFCLGCLEAFLVASVGELTEAEPELKPCPFCGTQPTVEQGRIKCGNMQCPVVVGCDFRDEWNRRA